MGDTSVFDTYAPGGCYSDPTGTKGICFNAATAAQAPPAGAYPNGVPFSVTPTPPPAAAPPTSFFTAQPKPAPLPLPAPTPTAPAPTTAPNETASNYYYVADVELVQNQLRLLGDTWDNADSIVNQLYAQGVQPGTVTIAQAQSLMTGVTATTTAATTSSLTDVSSWPWYYWAGAAAAGLFLFTGKK